MKMKNMSTQVWMLTAALVVFSSPAAISVVAEDDTAFYFSEDYNTIDSVETYDVTELTEMVRRGTTVLEGAQKMDGILDSLNEADVILDKIISMGDKIWKIIEKNKPVVTQSYQSTSAVPQGTRHWDQLDNWSAPQARVYRALYKNKFGMAVIDFSYRVAFTHSGSVDGKGKYLTGVSIEPAALDVAWGYKFNATGEILNTTNAGSKEAPVAGVEMRLNWQINTVMKHSQDSARFYVRGDGLFSNLTSGNMPAR